MYNKYKNSMEYKISTIINEFLEEELIIIDQEDFETSKEFDKIVALIASKVKRSLNYEETVDFKTLMLDDNFNNIYEKVKFKNIKSKIEFIYFLEKVTITYLSLIFEHDLINFNNNKHILRFVAGTFELLSLSYKKELLNSETGIFYGYKLLVDDISLIIKVTELIVEKPFLIGKLSNLINTFSCDNDLEKLLETISNDLDLYIVILPMIKDGYDESLLEKLSEYLQYLYHYRINTNYDINYLIQPDEYVLCNILCDANLLESNPIVIFNEISLDSLNYSLFVDYHSFLNNFLYSGKSINSNNKEIENLFIDYCARLRRKSNDPKIKDIFFHKLVDALYKWLSVNELNELVVSDDLLRYHKIIGIQIKNKTIELSKNVDVSIQNTSYKVNNIHMDIIQHWSNIISEIQLDKPTFSKFKTSLRNKDYKSINFIVENNFLYRTILRQFLNLGKNQISFNIRLIDIENILQDIEELFD